MTRVVLLSGWMGSGKDHVARVLVERHGYTRFAFADMVKDEVATLYRVPRELMDTHEGKNTMIGDRTVRRYLIDHAEACRTMDPLCWTRPVCRQILEREIDRVVISDWRMPAEHEGITAVFDNVTTLRVQRWAVHPSEPHVDPTESALDTFQFDAVFDNSGTTADLEQCVDHLADILHGDTSVV